ncbi:phasin family protein [Mesorhizobium soli]|uniref:phasin family protein n=1 Tax=Pseudaminobacter soli (ex Li et al. 2025) TaxID=1295366 RepID=UPI00247720D9|nr:TIGR01841 family phasin [Mesorhizobium soli]MDH6229623.1 phasin family protein [Mesorhizobium soli]
MAKKSESDTFTGMFTQLGDALKMPRVDVDAIIDHNRRNLEALQKAASASATGASELMSKQREIFQETLREITDMGQNFRAGNPQEMMTKQADFARRSFEAAVKNAGDSAEIMRKSGSESLDILRKRIHDAMEEIRSGYDKKK